MIQNHFWKILGGLLLPMNALRHSFLGYTRARDLPAGDIAKAIEYDWAVVERWRKALGNNFDLRGKTILELGPGPDLGVGLILVAYGAAQYIAVDRHPLAQSTPREFYNELIKTITQRIPGANVTMLNNAIEQLNRPTSRHSDTALAGEESHRSVERSFAQAQDDSEVKLRYICREDFSFADIPPHSIDLIVSNAAFEHFDDVADVIKRLTVVAKPNARFVADVDFQTHSRILRDRDPLNIYRFGKQWYTLWKFAGSPNRVRPHEYQTALKTNGWKDIVIDPLITLDEQTTKSALPFLAPQFRDPIAQMHYLDVMITATIPSL